MEGVRVIELLIKVKRSFSKKVCGAPKLVAGLNEPLM
jgi:hypothetical protein